MTRALTRPVVALLALVLGTACVREPERPNVLLITIDTLRQDRVSAFGYPRATTPYLDRLAEEGLVFTHCQSPRAKTTPAVASLMTGLYPHEHGVRDLTMPLPSDVPVLAEAFHRAGYRTAAIVGNFVLKDELSGLARGFDLWVEDLPDTQGVPPDDVPQRTARSLTDGALAALGLGPAQEAAGPKRPFVRDDRPWFLWVHYMDPHGQYDAPEEHRIFHSNEADPISVDESGEVYHNGPKHELSRPWVASYNVPRQAVGPQGRIDTAAIRDLYDAEVHYVDEQIGRLLGELGTNELLANTLVVATADHGESLGEHEYWFEHGRYAYEVTCRVPLIVRLPDAFPERPSPGRRTGDLSLVDLAPTLLELAGLDRLPVYHSEAQRSDGPTPRGRSQVRLVLRGEGGTRAVFSEKVERAEKSGAVQTKAVRLGNWKFIRRYTHRSGPNANERELVVLSEELYDVANDPYEANDLSSSPPPDAPLDRLRAELFDYSRADVHFEDLARLLQAKREELERNDRETLRILEALGY
jgi:arylsulfatase A-like enzyme